MFRSFSRDGSSWYKQVLGVMEREEQEVEVVAEGLVEEESWVEPEDAEVALLGRALSHPARVKILRLLEERGDRGCGDLVEELPLAQSTVSQHLKVLREAGLLTWRNEGARTNYSLSSTGMRRMRVLISSI